MNNQVCTPATAARLKAAVFPQPDPEPGQVWYTANDDAFIVLIGEGLDGVTAAWLHEGGTFTEPIDTEIDYYAPTAPDILRMLGFTWNLFYSSVDDRYNCKEDAGDLWHHSNPAEACALAWEEENKR